MTDNKFKDLAEFKYSIGLGLDIVFLLRGTEYNISWENHKPFICICPDGDAVVFNNADDLLNNYKIGETPIGELWEEIDIEFM